MVSQIFLLFSLSFVLREKRFFSNLAEFPLLCCNSARFAPLRAVLACFIGRPSRERRQQKPATEKAATTRRPKCAGTNSCFRINPLWAVLFFRRSSGYLWLSPLGCSTLTRSRSPPERVRKAPSLLSGPVVKPFRLGLLRLRLSLSPSTKSDPNRAGELTGCSQHHLSGLKWMLAIL